MGERLLDLRPRDPRVASALAWPVFHEHFELFTRPASHRDAVKRELLRGARREPSSLWLAYFRVLWLRYPGYEGALRRADYALVRAADPARYGWMRWEARRNALDGDEGLADDAALAADLAAARAAGLRPNEPDEPRRL